MKHHTSSLIALIIFSITFALVEATVVFYLRKLFGLVQGFINSYQILLNLGVIAFLTPESQIFSESGRGIEKIEMFREVATIIMLFSVAYLTGKNIKQKIGAFLIAFSSWDIFYYIFLKILTGWPKTLFDTDFYFLLPVPWVGPVITPLLISTILCILGLKLFSKNSP